jgi:hypothetical protein
LPDFAIRSLLDRTLGFAPIGRRERELLQIAPFRCADEQRGTG